MESFEKKLNQRRTGNELRVLSDFKDKIDFFSNDYLGFAKVKLHSDKSSGSTGSRLISGNSNFITNTERQFADFFNQEASLFFNSGYDANLGIFSSVLDRNDVVIYDELAHASIRDGIRLSNAKSFGFKHNDLSHLEQRLTGLQEKAYVVVESVYSMDGDIAPLREISDLCQKYQAKLIVDEAHSVGVFGRNGVGLVSEFGLDEVVFAKVMTYGKAFGLHGASVLGSQNLIEFLYNFSRPFIYTTGPSDHHIDLLRLRLEQISNAYAERKKLFDNIASFGNLLSKNIESPIVNFEVGGIDQTSAKSKILLYNGIATKPIYSPTVPKGSERLRICLHSFNLEKELILLNQILTH